MFLRHLYLVRFTLRARYAWVTVRYYAQLVPPASTCCADPSATVQADAQGLECDCSVTQSHPSLNATLNATPVNNHACRRLVKDWIAQTGAKSAAVVGGGFIGLGERCLIWGVL